jgi:hypothetical protein
MSVDGIERGAKGFSTRADWDLAGLHTDAEPLTHIRGVLMKFRLFRLATTVAMLAVLIEALGAGAKWG